MKNRIKELGIKFFKLDCVQINKQGINKYNIYGLSKNSTNDDKIMKVKLKRALRLNINKLENAYNNQPIHP